MWLTIIEKFLDFLKHPSALGVLALLSLICLVIYSAPLALMTWTSFQNTDRLEAAINRLAEHCIRNSYTSQEPR